MLEQIAKNIRERNLFRDGERILVAVSGGVDSMCLLHGLQQLAPEHEWKLTVAHFNHRLRGRASDADEKLVRRVAKKLGVECVVGAGDVKAHAAKTGQSIEMAARELRHAFLARTAKKMRIKTVALAHHADDQVELFFLRLLRGASPEGLAGMRWRSTSPADKLVQLARPLLNVSRKVLEDYAGNQKIAWHEDKTNLVMDFLRNRVRRELIPLLETHYQRGLRNNVARLMELLRAETEVVAHATNEALSSKQAFDQLAVAVQRRVIQQQLIQIGLATDFTAIEALRLHAGTVVEVNPQTRLVRDERGRIRLLEKFTAQFSEESRTLKLKPTVTAIGFGDCRLTFKVTNETGTNLSADPKMELFDADKVGRVVVLRHWRVGDRFQPIASKFSRKLQDMFTDLKIPKHDRHTRIVATTKEGEIFWVEGLRIAEKFKLTANTTRRLALKWARE